MALTADEQHELAASLYARRGQIIAYRQGWVEGLYTPGGSPWEPVPNECHLNADKVHRYSGGKYTPVRGWRCIDYGTHMTFSAHSIVLTDEDAFMDITPPRLGTLPPFVIDEHGEQWWVDVVGRGGLQQVTHFK